MLIGAASTAKKYTEDHEAVVYDDQTQLGTVSITDYAQSSLGDVVYVELPQTGSEIAQGRECNSDKCSTRKWGLTLGILSQNRLVR